MNARLVLILLVALAPSAAAVCTEPQPRLICAEYYASGLIVEAKLTRTTPFYDKSDRSYPTANIYVLKVNRTYRGTAVERVRVFESNDSGRTTFGWRPGVSYLLFLFRSPGQKYWYIDGCGNSGPARTAAAALKQIGAIDLHSTFGTIQGVVSQSVLGATLPGARVEARASDQRYAARTDQNGEFQMRVPIGTYSLSRSDKSFTFKPFELSYSDPRNLLVEPGGCVQVQLTAEEKHPR